MYPCIITSGIWHRVKPMLPQVQFEIQFSYLKCVFLTNPFWLLGLSNLFKIKRHSNKINHHNKSVSAPLVRKLPKKKNMPVSKMANLRWLLLFKKKKKIFKHLLLFKCHFYLRVIKCFQKEPITYLFGPNKERRVERAKMKWVMAVNAFSNYYFSGWNTFNQYLSK